MRKFFTILLKDEARHTKGAVSQTRVLGSVKYLQRWAYGINWSGSKNCEGGGGPDAVADGLRRRAEEMLIIRLLYSSEASVRRRSCSMRCACWVASVMEVTSAVRVV